MKRVVYLIIVAVVLLASIGATSHPQRPVWEYKLEYKMNEKKANELGAQGWELAAIESSSSAGPGSNVPTYVFKRAR